jgi:hypothetical protein
MGAIQLGLRARRRSESFEVDDIGSETFDGVAPEPSAGSDKTAAALAVIATYVPGEALAFHITASALLSISSPGADALLTAVTLAIVVALVICAYFVLPSAARDRTKCALSLAFALVSALVYLAALPSSFAHSWSAYTGPVSAVVVIAASILLPAIGAALRVIPISAAKA